MARSTPDEDTRDTRVVIYMTESDGAYLTRIAKQMGFKGRSEMIVAVLERLIIGGFAVAVWLKAGIQFLKRMDETGTADGSEFYFGVRPLPALPVEDDPTPKEVRKVLTEIRKETINQEATC